MTKRQAKARADLAKLCKRLDAVSERLWHHVLRAEPKRKRRVPAMRQELWALNQTLQSLWWALEHWEGAK